MSYNASEALIQAAIRDWLRAAGIQHWRMNIGPVMRGRPGAPIFGKNELKGFPDIFGFLPGTVRGEIFCCEVKKENGKLSPEQKIWRGILERAGVFYIEARSVDDVANAFAARFG